MTKDDVPSLFDKDSIDKKNLLDATVHELVTSNAISTLNSSKDNLEALNIVLDALGSKK